jgi:membrane associated rhomboid family serine protease
VRSARPLSLAARGVPVVTYALIGINLAVFVAVLAWPALTYMLAQHAPSYCFWQGQAHSTSDALLCAEAGGSFSHGTSNGAWWELLTSTFTHQQVWHIASNMISLWMVGPLVEFAVGRTRYLAAYLITGLAGSVLVLLAGPGGDYSLGASGSIFGLLGMLVILFLRRGLPMQQLGIVVALSFFITFSVPGISWQAHLGGFLAGLGIGALLAYTPLGRRN